MSEIPKSIEGLTTESPVRWAMDQTRHGLYTVLVGGGKLLVTTLGGAVRIAGGAVGGAMEGAARGIQDVFQNNKNQGPAPAPAGA